MRQLIICSSFDLHRLEDIIAGVSLDTLVLMSRSDFDESILKKIARDGVKLNSTYDLDSITSRVELFDDLKGLEKAYFVISNPVMSSSAYQAMIYSLYPKLLQADCWKITLEPAVIRLGFAFLRNLPEGLPT